MLTLFINLCSERKLSISDWKQPGRSVLRSPPAQFLSAPPHPCSLCCSDQLPASHESCSPTKLVCFRWKHYIHKSESGFVEVLLVWFSLEDGEEGKDIEKKRRWGQTEKAKSSWILLLHRAGVTTTSVDCCTENISVRGMCLKNGKVTVGRGAHCLPAAAQMFVRPLFTSVLIQKGQSFLKMQYS